MDFALNRCFPQVSSGWTRLAWLFILLLAVAKPGFAGEVALAWDPVTSPSLSGYMLHYGTTAGNYTAKLDVGNTTGYRVQNLSEGSTYYFAVTAYDAARAESGFSNEVSAVVTASTPVASFSVSTRFGIAPLAVNFVNGSTGTITAYAWNFGDGRTSSSQNPGHVYSVAGVYTVSLTVTGPGGSDTKTIGDYVTVTTIPAPNTGSLNGSWTSSPAVVDLTSLGSSDWAVWPGYVRSASGGGQISDVTVTGSADAETYSGSRRTMTWSNGYPTASGTTDDGVSVAGTGNGFQLTAPAGTATRTLSLYVGVQRGTGTLTARLSDGSAPDYVNTYSDSGWPYDSIYQLTYRAASEGQTVSVEWTQSGNATGRVRLQGAALSVE